MDRRLWGAIVGVGLAAGVLTGVAGASHTTQTQFLITPTRFEFGDVVVGKTSPDQQVTVTNATSAPIVVSMAGGAAGDFGGFQDCQGKTLAPAASCHITYQFTPPSPGSDTGSTSGSINGQNFAFAFHGTGVADDPEFLITPTRLDFGKVSVGTTSPDQQVTVKNVGRGPVVVSMAGGAAGDFGGFQDCQGKTLNVGDVCHITYQFTPPSAGPDVGSTSGSINGQSFSFAFNGTGVDPRFRISPTRLDFGDVQSGETSPDQQVGVTNIGFAPVVVSMAGGAGGDFGGFQDCQGKTLNVGDTCHITYQFTAPSASGPDTGSTSGSINGQPFAFDFKGNSVAPRFRISATRFDFGEVPVGTTSPDQQVTVTNIGLAPVVVSMAGGAGGAFGGFQDCQGKTLNVGDSCHITYQFTPVGVGAVTGSTSGSINGQSFAFDFSGTGITFGSEPSSTFMISPTRFDFGRVQTGTTSDDQQVTVTNISSSSVVVSMAGGAAGDFGGFQDCQGKTLAPGASCHITYQFTPPSAGPDTGSTSGTINGQPFSFDFNGTGVDPRFRISGTRLDFGDVPVSATSPDQQVAVTNIGISPVVVSMAGGAAGDFGGFQDCQGKTLNVGDTCHITYQFTPPGIGPDTGSTSGSINGQAFAFDFKGNGVEPYRISPTRLEFGKIQLGTTSPDQQVTVTNITSSSVVVSMAGGAAGDFGGFQDCQGKTLAPGASCHITYQFTPTSAGSDTGSTSGSINGQSFAFDFHGTGVAPKFLITPTRFDFGETIVGTTSPDQQVAVTNAGLAPVVVSMAGGAAGDFGGFQDCQGKTLNVGDTCHITYQFTPPGAGADTGSTSGSINGQPFAFDFSGIGMPLVDTTPPAITPSVAPPNPDGANGWYHVAPTVSFAVHDDESAILSTNGCSPTTVSADTPSTGVVLTCTATSAGGTASKSVTIKKDATAPTVTCGSTPTFALNGAGTVSASVTDSSSGPASATLSAAADTSTLGAHSVSLTGSDVAGNTTTVSCPYVVGLRFLGFLAPFKDSVKAGQQVVVRFALGDASGAPLADDLAQSLAAACAVRVTFIDDSECATYDPIAHAFLAQLRTSRDAVPGTYNVVVRVTSGGTLVATGSRPVQLTNR